MAAMPMAASTISSWNLNLAKPESKFLKSEVAKPSSMKRRKVSDDRDRLTRGGQQKEQAQTDA